MDGAETKPTLETILERMNEMRAEMRARFDAVDKQFEAVDKRFESVGISLDRVESVSNQTRAEMLTLRADFKEWQSALKEHLPALR
jgi:predicted  nucleic acid-binding Zn-ribbon protein